MSTIRKKSYSAGLVSASILFTPLSLAIENEPYRTESGIEIAPYLSASYGYDDNITQVSNDTNKTSSPLLEVTPAVAIKAERGESTFSAGYALTNGSYSQSSQDNYLDHRFRSDNFLRFNTRNGLALNYSYMYLHENRGSGISEGDNASNAINEPLKYDSHDINSTYVYGSENAKGRLEGSLGYGNRIYKNFRYFEAAPEQSSRFNDYDENRYAMSFYYQVMPNTEAIFDIKKYDRRYKHHASSATIQDSNTIFYYLGAKWDISGKTNGTIKLGLQDKDFISANTEGFNGFSWSAELEWTPKEYSTITALTSQAAKDPEQDGDYIEEQYYQLGWKHYWSAKVYNNITIAHRDENYTGVNREETTNFSDITLGYEIRRWFEISANWKRIEKDSSLSNYGYKQNYWGINANVTL
ncbi:outer membrane beta-barrel protein [Vibrio sp. Of7-15]|uniref:outer membrane beta-barrel protein n=1 Tax=Vibrio sp. Of7-15 TaxID=2724879 RepID=UPI001EF2E848|nr:outer membrane beta-barrel protein [Vibrio sp. Of7-15]MCG7498515.1 outer membrane beta-barrel protein [Vibrio sp. Of7-15]